MMILQSNLLEALKMVAGATAKKSTLEVLKNIALKANDGFLQISGTDLETYVTVNVDAVGDDIETTVPSKLFVDLVSNLENERVDLEQDALKLYIKQAETEAEIASLPYNEFPLLPESEGETFWFDAPELISAMRRVEHAAANDESRPILTGMHFLIQDDKLTLACADGFRLTVETLDTITDTPYRFTVPVVAIRQVVKLAKEDGKIAITANENNVCFSLPNTESIVDIKIYCQLLQGTYVNYEQIIPASHTCITDISVKTLKDALKLASVMAKEEGNYSVFEIQENGIALLSAESEHGQVKKFLDCAVDGEPMDVALNTQYVLQAIANLDGNIVLETTSSSRPVVIRSGNYLCVIMPMHRRK